MLEMLDVEHTVLLIKNVSFGIYFLNLLITFENSDLLSVILKPKIKSEHLVPNQDTVNE